MSNRGALISLKDGGFISIHGDYNSGLNGSFDNEDTVFLFGDWINNAGNTGFNEPLEGTVVFLGNDQHIKGSDITEYYNLDHRGGGTKFGDLDVIVEGRTGMLIPPGDPVAISAALRQLIPDADLRQRYGAARMVRVTQVYTWEETAQMYLSLLEEI